MAQLELLSPRHLRESRKPPNPILGVTVSNSMGPLGTHSPTVGFGTAVPPVARKTMVQRGVSRPSHTYPPSTVTSDWSLFLKTVIIISLRPVVLS